MSVHAGIFWDTREPPPPGFDALHLRPSTNNESINLKSQKKHLPPLSVSVVGHIVHDTAKVTVSQLFWNNTNQPIWKGSYTFPLSAGCTVTSFTCRVGRDKIIKAKINPKPEARDNFEEALRTNRSAGLVELNTTEIFTTTLGNIPANTKLRTEITYITLLKHHFADQRSTTSLTIPTTIAPRYGNPPSSLQSAQIHGISHGISIEVDVVAEETPHKISSTSHKITIEKGIGRNLCENWAEFATVDGMHDLEVSLVKLEHDTSFLDEDFVLEISREPRNGLETPTAWLETHPTLANHRAVMLTIPPSFMLRDQPCIPDGEIIFLADRSGSMEDKMSSLKSAMQFFLKGIPQGLKFNIWCFGSNYSSLWPESKEYSEHTLQLAMNFVAGQFSANMGGTELLSALEAIVKKKSPRSPAAEIVMLTDGEVWRQDETIQFVKNASRRSEGRIRFFALGIGNAVSHELVEGIAKAGGGYAEVIPAASQGGWEDRVVAILGAALAGHVGPCRIELDKEPERDTARGGGSSTRPRITQSPADMSTLSPFLRNRAFILFDDASYQTTPEHINIKFNTPRGEEIATSIPIIPLERKDSTLHKLGARALLADLERGQSWIHLDLNAPARGSTQEQNAVRKEGELLGCKWSLVSRWTSFFAVEESYHASVNSQVPFLDEDGDQVRVALADLDLLRPRGVAAHQVNRILPSESDSLSEEEEDEEEEVDSDSSLSHEDFQSESEGDSDSDNDGNGGQGRSQGAGNGSGQQEPDKADKDCDRDETPPKGQSSQQAEHSNSNSSAGARDSDYLNDPAIEKLGTFSMSSIRRRLSGATKSAVDLKEIGGSSIHTVSYCSTSEPRVSALPKRPEISTGMADWSSLGFSSSDSDTFPDPYVVPKKSYASKTSDHASEGPKTKPSTPRYNFIKSALNKREGKQTSPTSSEELDPKIEEASRRQQLLRTMSFGNQDAYSPVTKSSVASASIHTTSPNHSYVSGEYAQTPTQGYLDAGYFFPGVTNSNYPSATPSYGYSEKTTIGDSWHSSTPSSLNSPPAIIAPNFNMPASSAMHKQPDRRPRTAQELAGERKVRDFLTYQRSDGSFTSGFFAVIGFNFDLAVESLTTVKVTFDMAITAAILMLLEEKFDYCRDLWQLMYNKAKDYMKTQEPIESDRLLLLGAAREKVRAIPLEEILYAAPHKTPLAPPESTRYGTRSPPYGYSRETSRYPPSSEPLTSSQRDPIGMRTIKSTRSWSDSWYSARTFPGGENVLPLSSSTEDTDHEAFPLEDTSLTLRLGSSVERRVTPPGRESRDISWASWGLTGQPWSTEERQHLPLYYLSSSEITAKDRAEHQASSSEETTPHPKSAGKRTRWPSNRHYRDILRRSRDYVEDRAEYQDSKQETRATTSTFERKVPSEYKTNDQMGGVALDTVPTWGVGF